MTVGVFHLHYINLLALTVTSDDTRGQLDVFLTGITIDKSKGSAMADSTQMRILIAVTLQEVPFAFFARHDQFVVRNRTDMPTDLEQQDIVELILTITTGLPEIGQLYRVLFIGKETTAASWLGIISETVPVSYTHLTLPTILDV